MQRRLEAWLKAGLRQYATTPIYLEQVFWEPDQEGVANIAAERLLEDFGQRWIPDFWTGGVVRFGGEEFPIVANTDTQLIVIGDPSLLVTDDMSYQIVSVDIGRFQQFLLTPSKTITVDVSFARQPTQFPHITIRLQDDHERQPYIGESIETTVVPDDPPDGLGVAQSYYSAENEAAYLLTIWAENAIEVEWLYQWLVNYIAQSKAAFAAWGLNNTSFQASDFHPEDAFLPEQGYRRYVILSAARQEQALLLTPAEQITKIETVPDAQEVPIYYPVGLYALPRPPG